MPSYKNVAQIVTEINSDKVSGHLREVIAFDDQVALYWVKCLCACTTSHIGLLACKVAKHNY